MGRLKAKGLEIEQSPISMKGVAAVRRPGRDRHDQRQDAEGSLRPGFERGEDFPAVYEREKPQQISDTGALEKIIDEVIAANPKQVEQYRGRQEDGDRLLRRPGDEGVKGQANPALVNELLAKKLEG